MNTSNIDLVEDKEKNLKYKRRFKQIFSIAAILIILIIIIITISNGDKSGKDDKVQIEKYNLTEDKEIKVESYPKSIDTSETQIDSEGNIINYKYVRYSTGLPEPENIYSTGLESEEEKIKAQISNFYTNIGTKDWDRAYDFSSGKLTKEQFINLYEGVNFIKPSLIEVDLNNLSANYIVSIDENGIFDFYNVNINLTKLSDGKFKILNSNSESFSDSYFLDCKQQPNSSSCNLRRSSDNKVIVLGMAAYSTKPLVFLGKEDSSLQYFYSAIGDGGVAGMTIWGINKETGKVHYIGSYHLNIPYEKYYSNPSCAGNEAASWKLENYYTSECLLMFKDEEWYKDNVEFLEAEEKYLH